MTIKVKGVVTRPDPKPPEALPDSQRPAKTLSEVYKYPDVPIEPKSDYPEIPVDYSALQPFAKPTISRTPQDLWDMVDGLTDLQAQQVIQPFVGQLITVTGTVRSVAPVGPGVPGLTMVVIQVGPSNSVVMFFENDRWLTRLSGIRAGDEITGQGSISRIVGLLISLDNCGLV